jgi:hypothetical protein
MIGETFLAFYSNIGGGQIGNLLFQMEQAGVFSYLLPFLLIFAVVFGILSKINIFSDKDGKENKSINVIIALVASLLSLQFGVVSMFFAEIFPRFGIGISILLVVLVLGGIFIPGENKAFLKVLSVGAFVVIGYVILGSIDSFNWYMGSGFSYFWGEHWATIVGVVVFLGLIIAIIAGGPKDRKTEGSVIEKALLASK